MSQEAVISKETMCNFEQQPIMTIVGLAAVVSQNQKWSKAIRSTCPDTCGTSDIWMMGGTYSSVSNISEKSEFVLINCPGIEDGDEELYGKICRWAERNGHQRTNPREVFAIADQHDLVTFLQSSKIYLVSTTDVVSQRGDRRTCYVFIDDENKVQKAHVIPIHCFKTSDDWFVFRASTQR